MKVIVTPELTPQYFTKMYQSNLKKIWFDAWYRGMKASRKYSHVFVELLKANDEFMKENPDYVEGAICGKLKK